MDWLLCFLNPYSPTYSTSVEKYWLIATLIMNISKRDFHRWSCKCPSNVSSAVLSRDLGFPLSGAEGTSWNWVSFSNVMEEACFWLYQLGSLLLKLQLASLFCNSFSHEVLLTASWSLSEKSHSTSQTSITLQKRTKGMYLGIQSYIVRTAWKHAAQRWYNGGSGMAEIPNSWIFCGMRSIDDDYWQR